MDIITKLIRYKNNLYYTRNNEIRPSQPPSVNSNHQDGVQYGGLTWHYVLHVILLFASFLFAQTNGCREENNGAPKRNAHR